MQRNFDTNEIRDKVFKNIHTGRTIRASSYAYENFLNIYQSSKLSKEVSVFIHPKKVSKHNLIEIGIGLLKDNEDWKEL